MHEEHLDEIAVRKLQIDNFAVPELGRWRTFLERIKNPSHEVEIVLVGKYVELQDAYKSIQEAFVHAGAANDCRVNVRTLQSETITPDNVAELLKGADGILVAPGFGERGLEGKVHAIKHVRENGIPFLGICLGMQMCVVEFARNVLGYADASSTEKDPDTTHPVIDMMEEQKKTTIKGGTMRLGAYACDLKEGSLAASLYGSLSIRERHRHRYEFNSEYLDEFEKNGMMATGRNPETGLVEIVELPSHPFFIGSQFHPEYKSTPEKPHPLFKGLVAAALEYKKVKG
jgi:CTP synthase